MKQRPLKYFFMVLLSLALNMPAIAEDMTKTLSEDQLIFGDKHGCDKKEGADTPDGCFERMRKIERRRVEELVARITSLLKEGAEGNYPFPAKGKDDERKRMGFRNELEVFVANQKRWQVYRETMCITLAVRSSGKGSITEVVEGACHLEVDRGHAEALLAIYYTYTRRIF